MKTAKDALRATLMGLLFTLPLAGFQAFEFWTLRPSLPQTSLVFVLWTVALVPLPGLRILAAFPGMPVAHGLGLSRSPGIQRTARNLTLAIGSLSLVGAVLLLAVNSPGLHMAAGLVAMVLSLVLGMLVLAGLRGIPARKRMLKAAIDQWTPDAVIYTGRSDGGAYQIQQWLPTIQAIIPKVLIVTRHAVAAEALAAALPAGTPIVVCRENADLDMAMHSGAKIVFYVNSVATNSTVVNYRFLHHVYLGHGDSDKEISAHPVHRMYDSIFVSGQAAVDRYFAAGVPLTPGQSVLVGRPQLASILPVTHPGPIKTVLYAPTWSGYNLASSLSSLARAEPFIRDLLDRGMRVIFRPHPFSMVRGADPRHVAAIDALLLDSRGDHMTSREASTRDLYELFNESHAMATDVSSIVVDYLATGKPMAILVAGVEPSDFRLRYPTSASAYVAASPDSPEWKQLFEADVKDHERSAVAKHYVVDTSAKSFNAAIASILAGLEPGTAGQTAESLFESPYDS